MGAEDVVIDADGNAWTGTEDGSIFRVTPDGSVQRVGHTGGRPLGLELLADGRLLVADAYQGLLAMSTTTGVVERLVTEVDGQRLLLCNNAGSRLQRRHLVLRLQHGLPAGQAGGRTSPSTPAPVGCCAGERTVPWRSISMASPSRTA